MIPSVFDARVVSNELICSDIWLLRMAVPKDLSSFSAGEFLHIKVDSGEVPLFRRAYSILTATKTEVEVLYKVLGVGTRLLCRRKAGDIISIMGPLGNAFSAPGPKEMAVCVAGGVGLPPILRWAVELTQKNMPADRLRFIYGARSVDELVLRDRVEMLGCTIQYATDDGSLGHHGRVTELLEAAIKPAARLGYRVRFYACGPEPMLEACSALCVELDIEGVLSLETPMPCGSGVCLGCVIPCRTSGNSDFVYRRTCVDGPVFNAREVMWA